MDRPSRVSISVDGGSYKEYELTQHNGPTHVVFRVIEDDPIETDRPCQEEKYFFINNVIINGIDHTKGTLRLNLSSGKRLRIPFSNEQADTTFRNFLEITSSDSRRSSSCLDNSGDSRDIG